MPTTNAIGPPAPAIWVNLFIPGGGLVLVGRARMGIVLALAFAISANTALVSRLILPDDVPNWLQNLAIILACVLYIAANGLLLSAARPGGQRAKAAARNASLREIERLVAAGEFKTALRLIEVNRRLVEGDLHLAFRRAQLLTEVGDDAAALAWKQLGSLDRHGIYRAERLEGLARAQIDH